MSLIMDLIGQDLSELFALEFAKQVSDIGPSWSSCYSIFDRFIQRQPCAFVNFFFKKLLRNLRLDFFFLPNFTGMILRGLKTSLHHCRKIGPVERYRHSGASSLKKSVKSDTDTGYGYVPHKAHVKNNLSFLRERIVCCG